MGLDEADGLLVLREKYYILMFIAITVLNSRNICDCSNDSINYAGLCRYLLCNHSRETESHQHR